MKITIPFVFLLLAAAATALSIFGEGGFENLSYLKRSVKNQWQRNAVLRDSVDSMKQEVVRLENDPRTLEKAARNELGLARQNEVVVIFDDEKEPK